MKLQHLESDIDLSHQVSCDVDLTRIEQTEDVLDTGGGELRGEDGCPGHLLGLAAEDEPEQGGDAGQHQSVHFEPAAIALPDSVIHEPALILGQIIVQDGGREEFVSQLWLK